MSLAVAGFKSSPFFDQLNSVLQSDASLRKKTISTTDAIIVITLNNKEGQQSWAIDLAKTGEVSKIDSVDSAKPDVTLILKDIDFKKLIAGKVSGQKLFMSGRLKVKGNMMKATAIETVLKAAAPPKAKL